MERELAIDIHNNKLLEWLIDRRHCERQWQDAAAVVRHKITAALQDMPESAEITELLKGCYINYFHCKRIVQVLASTEASSKNIFGRYSSTRMRDWQEVVGLYEKDGLYLAECAQILRRLVTFEIPAVKKHVEKARKRQEECSRKERDYMSHASEWKEKYRQRCQTFGIKGERVKSELLSLVRDLPASLSGFVSQLHSLRDACQYYTRFTAFVLKRPVAEDESLPIVRCLLKHGNVTTYEWRTGSAPSVVDAPQLVTDEEEQATEDTIDWGDGGGDIKWDAAGAEDIVLGEETTDIDWSITTVQEIEQPCSATDAAQPVQLSTTADDDVATGSDALSVLENPRTRSLLLDELHELSSFLRMRSEELSASGSDLICSSLLQVAPEELQKEAVELVEWNSLLMSLLNDVTSDHMTQLLMIRTSPRYVERVAESLKQKLRQGEMCEANARLMQQNRADAVEEEKKLAPKVKMQRERMKELQKQTEKEISKKYKDRPVNIMGEINTV